MTASDRAASRSRTWHERATALSAVASLALGLTVALGWHTHNDALIQVRPTYTPMVYNTAACFALCGVALVALLFEWRRAAVACGALVVAASLLTLSEYLAGWDLGIDRLLIEPYLSVGTARPGRMAPNTAMCFAACGAAAMLLSFARVQSGRAFAAGCLASIAAAIAASGLSGYLTGVQSAYGWGPLVPMAVHTSAGAIVLATGILLHAWVRGTRPGESVPRWFPILVGVAVATLAVGQWQAAVEHARIDARALDEPGHGGTSDVAHAVLPSVVLVGGIAMAVLIATAVYFAQRSRLRERETAAANRRLEREAADRCNAERALRGSEGRLRQIVETMTEGLFIVDRDGRIVFANAMAEKLVGLSRDVITQRAYDAPDWKLLTLDGKPFPARELPVARVMRDLAPVFGVEFVMERTDASRVVLSVNAAPLFDGAGAPDGVVASVSDVTRRKELEDAKDALISTVSHELRTPLASLRGFAELMLERDYEPEKRREFLEIIHGEAVRLTDLINDFLDIQRMQSGNQRYELERTDLAALLRSTERLFAGNLDGHLLRLAIARGLPPVRADADRMRQVLANLVSNALKFSPRGSQVTLGARAEGDQAVIWVRDEGIGIPAEALPQLFTKFFRVESAETRAIGGTGLGLAIVKEIVEAHGGRVWVESAPGRGSTFSVGLPCAEPPDDPPSMATPAGEPAEILLVENDDAFARWLAERFGCEGLSLRIVASGEAALEILRASPHRLAILDVHLAGAIDGWDVLTAMKSDPALRSVPVLIISASDAVNRRGLAVAGADYVVKPIARKWLVEAAKEELGSLRGKRILVADDDPSFRAQVQSFLGDEGVAEVAQAADGREALAAIGERVPDLLLLDLLMPEVDGFEVLRRLRLDRRAVNLPVLVTTSKDLSRDDKTYVKRRMATLVRKGGGSPSAIVQAAQRELAVAPGADRGAA